MSQLRTIDINRDLELLQDCPAQEGACECLDVLQINQQLIDRALRRETLLTTVFERILVSLRCSYIPSRKGETNIAQGLSSLSRGAQKPGWKFIFDKLIVAPIIFS
ncbi:hypothetical protein BOO89_20175 [Stutzerimonas stutzeri]|nr:hypothetical protein BOO89_20175 [Stutzerimonas stutzeri]